MLNGFDNITLCVTLQGGHCLTATQTIMTGFFGKLNHLMRCRGRVDAIEEIKKMKKEHKSRVQMLKQRAYTTRATGVVFVTFLCSVVAKASKPAIFILLF